MSLAGRQKSLITTRAAMVAGGAIAAVLVVSPAGNAGSIAAVGLLAGVCYAEALRVTAATEPRFGTLIAGLLAAVGGVAALFGGTVAVAIQVPWPPTPPVPFLNVAPFLALGAGMLVGFGTVLTVRDSPDGLSRQAGTAWRRVYVVGLFPALVALVGFPNPPGAAFALIVGLGGLAVIPAIRGEKRFGDAVPPVAAALTALVLVAAVAAVRGPFESLAIRTARTESGRQYLVDSFEILGATTVVVGLLAIAVLVAVLFLLVVAAVGQFGGTDGPSGVGSMSGGVLLAAVSVGIAGGHPVVVFCGVAASLLVWDVGEYAVTLGHEVGYDGGTRRAELVHGVGAVALAAVGVLLAGGLLVLAGIIPSVSRAAAVLAVAVAVVGTLLLFLAVR